MHGQQHIKIFYSISSRPGMTHICINYTSHLFLKLNKIVSDIALFLMIPFFYWTCHFVRKNSRDLPPISTILILKHAACSFYSIILISKAKWCLTRILRRSHMGTVWFYTSTSNKRAARPKLYTKSLTRDLKLMYSRLTLVRISIKL